MHHAHSPRIDPPTLEQDPMQLTESHEPRHWWNRSWLPVKVYAPIFALVCVFLIGGSMLIDWWPAFALAVSVAFLAGLTVWSIFGDPG
jgi:hypothetical protein